MKAPINSTKHYVHIPIQSIADGARGSIILSTSVILPATAAANEVREGSVIKAIFLELWLSNDTADFTANACMGILQQGAAVPTFAQMNNMGAFEGKNNILEFHQGLAAADGNVIPMFRGWIKIPKGKQRQALGNETFCAASFTGSAGQFCGFATYKEYY